MSDSFEAGVAGVAGGGPGFSLTEEEVRSALGQVVDPEVGLDIITLGLVYGVVVSDGVVTIDYTLTTRGCPMEALISNAIVAVVSALEGVRDVDARIVWEPAWNPGMIREGAW